MKLCIVQIDCNVLPSNSILVPLVLLPWEQGGRLDTAEDSGYHNYKQAGRENLATYKLVDTNNQ